MSSILRKILDKCCNFKDLVTGKLPHEKELLRTLSSVADRLKKINWILK